MAVIFDSGWSYSRLLGNAVKEAFDGPEQLRIEHFKFREDALSSNIRRILQTAAEHSRGERRRLIADRSYYT